MGPCIRCGAIAVDYAAARKFEEKEPQYTLGKYRNVKGLGKLFGMYYQQDILTNDEIEAVLPPSLGYPEIKDQSFRRATDQLEYVELKQTDHLYLRQVETRWWKQELIKQN